MFIMNFFLLLPNWSTSKIFSCFSNDILNLAVFESNYVNLSLKERIKHRDESFSNFGIHE